MPAVDVFAQSEVQSTSEFNTTGLIVVAWGASIDYATLDMVDGLPVYVIVKDGFLNNNFTSQFTGIVNLPATAKVYLEGIERSPSGDNNAFTVWNALGWTIVKQGNDFSINVLLPTGANIRWTHEVHFGNILTGGEPVHGMQNNFCWMARTRGKLMFKMLSSISAADVLAFWGAATSTIVVDGIDLIIGTKTTNPTGAELIPVGVYAFGILEGRLKFNQISSLASKISSHRVVALGIEVDVGPHIKCRVPSSGNKSLQFAAKAGSISWSGAQCFFGAGLSVPTAISGKTMTTTFEYSAPISTLAANDRHMVIIEDATNGHKWRVELVAGNSNQLIMIQEL